MVKYRNGSEVPQVYLDQLSEKNLSWELIPYKISLLGRLENWIWDDAKY
jgi:hypothetical protein